MAKKVGGTKKVEKKDGEKKARKGRVELDYSKAVDADGNSIVNEDGKLTALPLTVGEGDNVVFEGWNPKKHKPLRKSDFAEEYMYMFFRAHVAQIRADQQAEKAKKLRKQAEQIQQFGDPKTRKKAKKLARMREQLAALEAELAGEGISLEDDEE